MVEKVCYPKRLLTDAVLGKPRLTEQEKNVNSTTVGSFPFGPEAGPFNIAVAKS